MKSEQSFRVTSFYVFLKILPFYSTLIPGIFSDYQYDYAASISVQKVQSSDNAYFAVYNDNSVTKIKTLPFRLNDCTIYLYDYWIGNDSYTNNLYSSPLCESFLYRQDPAYQDELRYKILFKFLFPNQNNCPIKRGESVIPRLIEMPFNYWNLDLPCKPWTYRQVILRQGKSLLTLDLEMNMLPKYKCAPSPSNSSNIQNRRHHQFIVVNRKYQDQIETQIEAPSAALSDLQFQPPSSFPERSRSNNLIIVQPAAPKFGSKNVKNACVNKISNIQEPTTNEKISENPKPCKWFTLQITRSCIFKTVYEIVTISENLVYNLL